LTIGVKKITLWAHFASVFEEKNMNFTDLGLSEKTIKAIKEAGIKGPTTVQADVIPSILAGKDIFTIAPQGCGKTSSYVFPLIDIIARKKAQTILILTADSKISAFISDQIAVFNRYHSEEQEETEDEANVIIASPDLVLELSADGGVDLSQTSILVVDDINLIKKKKQLKSLEKVLELLPVEKQNIVYTNRRSQETQGILEKILKSPQEIKVDKNKEQEANNVAPEQKIKTGETDGSETKEKSFDKAKKEHFQRKSFSGAQRDKEAVELMKKYNTFCGKTPEFLVYKGILVNEE